MKILVIGLLLYGFAVTIPVKPRPPKHVEKNKMSVNWVHHDNCVRFTLEAPTKGWLAIAFTKDKSIDGSYLILARIKNGKTEVQEFKTLALGIYKPIVDLGGTSMISSSEGYEKDDRTIVSFEVKVSKDNELQKDLSEGNEYCMHIAFSRDKDFSHHSSMRTNTQVRL